MVRLFDKGEVIIMLGEAMTPEKETAFWERMKIYKGMRSDGKDGKCIDVTRHNLGCVACPIGDGGLFEPEPLSMEGQQ